MTSEHIAESRAGTVLWPAHLQPPQYSDEVAAWVEAHVDQGAVRASVEELEALGADCPAAVLEYTRARNEWCAAIDAWRASLALDIHHGRGWRMYGGEWIRFSRRVEVDDYSIELIEASRRMFDRLGPDRFREYALAVYEMLRVQRRAEEAIGARIREVCT